MATRKIIATSPFLVDGQHYDAGPKVLEFEEAVAADVVHAGRARFAVEADASAAGNKSKAAD